MWYAMYNTVVVYGWTWSETMNNRSAVHATTVFLLVWVMARIVQYAGPFWPCRLLLCNEGHILLLRDGEVGQEWVSRFVTWVVYADGSFGSVGFFLSGRTRERWGCHFCGGAVHGLYVGFDWKGKWEGKNWPMGVVSLSPSLSRWRIRRGDGMSCIECKA